MSEFSIDDLPKQYDHLAAQKRWYAFWEEKKLFHGTLDPHKKPFSVVIPPPNVTGALHLGHALNNTLQDILVRQKRMQGYAVTWIPGTDHAGIATQAMVEKRLFNEEGKTRHDLGRDVLVQRIWDWKAAYEKRILGQLKEMGCSCDWDRLRFTLDPVCAKAVRQTFFRMFEAGWIYRGKRLVNWDTKLQTAVADDELFYDTVPGHFWYLKYPVIDPKLGEPDSVVVATTRPETMLGDTAVAVHPNPTAALAKVEVEILKRLETASEKDRDDIQSQLDEVRRRQREELPRYEQLAKMAKEGRQVMLPLVNRPIPLVADIWAKPELGTGCVKITPAHDPNDYQVGMRQKLPMINILNKDGTLSPEAGPYAGMSTDESRQKIVAAIESLGLLVAVEDRPHELPFSDRSKTPIEPFLNDQWFVKMETLAQTAMDAVSDGRVRISPSRYAKSYLDWLSEKRDWPIGRQLWWGHRIPIWYCQGASESELAAAFAGRDDVKWRWDDEGQQWWICSEQTQLVTDAVPGHTITQEEDVLDTWFSSALWPHSTLGWPEQTAELKYWYPTSVLITSRDIITLWVARMVLTGLFNQGDVPFHDVYIHSKILDGFGEGMSKSKGNGVDPIDVIGSFGADALRFGLAYLATETQDIRMPVEFRCPHCGASIPQTKENRILPSLACPKCKQKFSTQWAEKPEDRALPRGSVVSERFEIARNFCNKLWNAARFTMMNLEGYTAQPVMDADLAFDDRWILSRLSTVTKQVTDALAKFEYAEAARVLYEFAWDEFCSFYLEMVKTRMQDATQRPVAQRVLAHTLDTLLRLLHPFTPFLTEEIWQSLGKLASSRGLEPVEATESIMTAPWPEAVTAHENPTIEQQFAKFQGVLGALRNARARQNIQSRENLAFVVRCDAATAELMSPMTSVFTAMAGATPLAWGENVAVPALADHSILPGMEIFVDLAGHIDIAAELKKKRDELDKIEGRIVAQQKKLSNENFVSRAPVAVIEKERGTLADLEAQAVAVREAVARFEAM
ncbi:MAG: valine--tRNA ligase [Thermoguttaceae bacterium]|nr:valine--tRNA ligase [Thermoguttaceae bacterium]